MFVTTIILHVALFRTGYGCSLFYVLYCIQLNFHLSAFKIAIPVIILQTSDQSHAYLAIDHSSSSTALGTDRNCIFHFRPKRNSLRNWHSDFGWKPGL